MFPREQLLTFMRRADPRAKDKSQFHLSGKADFTQDPEPVRLQAQMATRMIIITAVARAIIMYVIC
jgi:hypothetical protein